MKYPGFKNYLLLRYSVLIWICTVIGPSTTFAQNIYKLWWNGNSRELVKFDITTCESLVLKDLADNGELGVYGALEMSFHPDGYLYMTVYKGTHNVFHIMRYQPKNKTVEEVSALELSSPSSLIAISEEGKVLLSRGANSDATLIYNYNLRMKNVVGNIDLPGFPRFLARNIQGIVKDGNILFGNALDMSSTGIWNRELQEFDSVRIITNYNYSHIEYPAIYYPACEPWQLVSLDASDSPRGEGRVILIDTTSRSVVEPCPGIDFNSNVIGAIATTTDFRQSPLRIDLDADNSSGHITAGYYDTLFTCRKMAPIADEDMELSTCGGEVDYISFRLKYYDQPRLPAEYITADGFEDQLKPTSSSRWVWENPFSNDTARIKDFLRSVRYHADWGNPNERERAVAITMHVGEDSTTSWSVYQLERDEVFAGRDTTITYCPDDGSPLELTDYLSTGVRKDGRIEPEPAGGGTVFTPGQDADGDYLYILEDMDCADTVVLTVESLQTGLEEIDLDTVTLCPGGRQRIGFPPGRYDSVEWWDGSTGDSVWVGPDGATDHYAIVNQGDCGIRIPITVVERAVEGSAGRDTTIGYCAEGALIDLKAVLTLSGDFSYEISPSLADGLLVFDPSVDGTGTYRLVAGAGSCTDTAIIEMEETTTQELMVEPVRLCAGSTQRIGLEPGVYDEVRWWNGDSGDSTTLSGGENGPFTVEARQAGCVYAGEVRVTEVAEVTWPKVYPDQMILCAGEPRTIPVSGLDSVKWMNAIHYPGDEIVLSEAGEYQLQGYRNGCSVEKTVTVKTITAPSSEFKQTISWCGRQPLKLQLPEDNTSWRFRWADGSDSTGRTIDSTGRYLFLIRSDSCEFTGYYDVVAGTDCEEDCTVSIPNAVTPNGDGVNDVLEVYSDCNIVVTDIRIFDKWGGALYSAQGEEIEPQIWEDIPPGVYTVQVTYATDEGVVKTVAGGVMVIK